jgi:hypothetical protein
MAANMGVKSVVIEFSWKGAAVQRVLETGNRGLTAVRNLYQVTTSEDTAGW